MDEELKQSLFTTIEVCRICNSESINEIFSYDTHVGDLFAAERTDAQSQSLLPLTLAHCSSCGHLQILETVEPSAIYSEYLYRSSTTPHLSQQYFQEARDLLSLCDLPKGALVVDIGSNDGASLSPFQGLNYRVLGVEPAREAASICADLGIDVLRDFFSPALGESILNTHGSPDLIMCKYTFANISDPQSWVRAFADMLSQKSTLAITTGYHPMQFDVNMFEYINHDHLHYFSVTSLDKILTAAGLEIFNVSLSPQKGGSLRVLARKASGKTEGVEQWLQRERWQQIDSNAYYVKFQRMMYQLRDDFWGFVRSQGLDKGRTWVGVGSSISTTHLVDFYGLDALLNYLIDDDYNKIGRYSPGSGLEVKPISASNLSQASNLPVILAWQHGDALKRRLIEESYLGPVLDVLPQPRFGLTP